MNKEVSSDISVPGLEQTYRSKSSEQVQTAQSLLPCRLEMLGSQEEKLSGLSLVWTRPRAVSRNSTARDQVTQGDITTLL